MARHDSCYICATWIDAGRLCRPCELSERHEAERRCSCGRRKGRRSSQCRYCSSSQGVVAASSWASNDRLAHARAYADDRVAKREAARRTAEVLRNREGANRRRARRRQNGVVPYRSRDIFVRDGWTCGLCLGAVDEGRSYPDPWCASIDHILPVSLGGPDAPDNVRLTHYRCNVLRGNRLDPRQQLVG